MTSMGAIKVEPLLVGHIVRRGTVIVDASSSVTLVRVGDRSIVVDTGSPRVKLKLVEALKSQNLAAADVDFVINTHMHVDHCGCNELFQNAMFIAHSLESPPAHYQKISGEMTLMPGVAVLPTPGHCAGAISVFVTADRKYAICGDALPTRDNFLKHVPPSVNTNPRLALKSMDMITSWADVVVPGHDASFEVLRKK